MNPFEGLFAPTWMVTIDDGGVRATQIGKASYIPFTDITDARVDFRPFGVALLRLVTRGATITLRVVHEEALFVHAAISPHIGVKPSVPAVAGVLARNGRPFDVWLADIRSGAGSGYRAAPIDSSALVAVLDDTNAAADVRAAAAYALLHDGREEDLVAVVRAFVRHALPPLVVVVASLAPGGAALVPEPMWRAALEFLSTEEATQALETSSRVVHIDEGHVYDLLRRATQEEIAAHNARVATEPRHFAAKRKHHASPLGGFASAQGVTRFK